VIVRLVSNHQVDRVSSAEKWKQNNARPRLDQSHNPPAITARNSAVFKTTLAPVAGCSGKPPAPGCHRALNR
jgi:hypothetical protein